MKRNKKSNGSNAETAAEDAKPELLIRLLKILFGVFLILFFFLVLALGMNFGKGSIQGKSMVPTLESGDKVLYSRESSIRINDLVVFSPPDDPQQEYIKRVVGLPGDHISYKNDVLVRNYENIKEPYIYFEKATDMTQVQNDFGMRDMLDRTAAVRNLNLDEFQRIPDNMYLVLGDNRTHSADSRDFGLIYDYEIHGVIKMVYWPFWHFDVLRF